VRKILATAAALAFAAAAVAGQVVVGTKGFNLNIPFCGT
jgi:hypothetical protein